MCTLVGWLTKIWENGRGYLTCNLFLLLHEQRMGPGAHDVHGGASTVAYFAANYRSV